MKSLCVYASVSSHGVFVFFLYYIPSYTAKVLFRYISNFTLSKRIKRTTTTTNDFLNKKTEILLKEK